MTEQNKPTNPWDPTNQGEQADPWTTSSTPAQSGSTDGPTSADQLAPKYPWQSEQVSSHDPLAPNDPWASNDAQNPWQGNQSTTETPAADPYATSAAAGDPSAAQPAQGATTSGATAATGGQPTSAQEPTSAPQSSNPWQTTEPQQAPANPWQTPQGQQPASDPYGQPAANAYGQTDPTPAQQDPYGQPVNPYGQSANAYGQPTDPWAQQQGAPVGYGQTDPNAVWGAQPGYYATNAPVLASWAKRAQGWLLDWLAPGIVFIMIWSQVFPAEPTVINGETFSSGTSRTASLLTFVCTALLMSFLNKNGQTPGRRWAKTQLVDEQGRPLQAGVPSLPRYALHILDYFCFLGWLWPLWDSNRQTFADKIAKTRVIDLRASGIDPNQPR